MWALLLNGGLAHTRSGNFREVPVVPMLPHASEGWCQVDSVFRQVCACFLLDRHCQSPRRRGLSGEQSQMCALSPSFWRRTVLFLGSLEVKLEGICNGYTYPCKVLSLPFDVFLLFLTLSWIFFTAFKKEMSGVRHWGPILSLLFLSTCSHPKTVWNIF